MEWRLQETDTECRASNLWQHRVFGRDRPSRKTEWNLRFDWIKRIRLQVADPATSNRREEALAAFSSRSRGFSTGGCDDRGNRGGTWKTRVPRQSSGRTTGTGAIFRWIARVERFSGFLRESIASFASWSPPGRIWPPPTRCGANAASRRRRPSEGRRRPAFSPGKSVSTGLNRRLSPASLPVGRGEFRGMPTVGRLPDRKSLPLAAAPLAE